jgi:D-beta-D-heptose 7-phosphate kinase / D-beta-D-heptose 1-phosphate adenosyltransferase
VIWTEAWLERLGTCRVLVVGDLMLDEYRRGHVERISPEAPVPILSVVARDATLGGAGNVVKNLRSLNVGVTVVGILGDDDAGEQILMGLTALGVSGNEVVKDARRVSTRKVRFVSMEHGQQVFRADEETAQDVSGEVEGKIIRQVREKAAEADVILCSDYLKGVLTANVLKAVFKAGLQRKVPVIVAPKDGEAKKYNGASILMPNLRELSRLVGTQMDGNAWLMSSARDLTRILGLEALLVTRGSEGMTLFEAEESGLHHVDIPTVAQKIYDVTGAGDTALAAFAAGIAAGASREAAAHLANIAAGVVVGKRGTAIVTKDEILEHLEEYPSQEQWTRDATQTLSSAGGE